MHSHSTQLRADFWLSLIYYEAILWDSFMFCNYLIILNYANRDEHSWIQVSDISFDLVTCVENISYIVKGQPKLILCNICIGNNLYNKSV